MDDLGDILALGITAGIAVGVAGITLKAVDKIVNDNNKTNEQLKKKLKLY